MRNMICYLSLLLAYGASAQTRIEWNKSYGGSLWDQSNAVRQTTDGGYVMAGYTQSNDGDVVGNHGDLDVWILKTDAVGELQWKQIYGGSLDERAEDIRQTADGGYIVVGYSRSSDGDLSGNKGLSDYWVLKLDAAGALEWQRNFGGPDSEAAYSVQQSPDGGYMVAGFSRSTNGDVSGNKGGTDYWVIKLDPSGNLVWQRCYGGSDQELAYAIIPTTDGNYVLAGYAYSSNGDATANNGAQDYWVLKINPNGNIIWQKNYGGSNTEYATDIQQTTDGGYIIGGHSFSSDGQVGANNGVDDAWIVKINANGVFQWGQVYGGLSYDEIQSICQTSDGGYFMAGLTRTPPGNGGGTNIDNAWVLKLNSAGMRLWEKAYGSNGIEQATSVLQATDGGLVFCGVSEYPNGDVSTNKGQLDFWLVKLAPQPGAIQGHLYVDLNDNCLYDTGDSILVSKLVSAENTVTGEILYASTDDQGYFLIETDTVPQLLRSYLPSPYFDSSACSAQTVLIPLSAAQPTATHDFFVTPVINCPFMSVELGSTILRRCVPVNYYVSYCNYGTTTADSAYVDITFAPELTVLNASIPWSTVNGQTYRFPVGDVAWLDCGQFRVTVQADCDSTYVGQTLCVEAHIYPDSNCAPIANWSGAELKATATCIGTDSVQLRVQNIGNADMPAAVPFLVIEDIIMRDGGQLQLNSQESAVWTIPIQGLTQRIIAQQPVNHPFKTYTTAAVNLCNTSNLPPFPGPVTDYFTAYANDEEEPFVAVDCQVVVASLDPNDKAVEPTGATNQGFISATTDLTYKIRFQNTGTDTAFTVVLIDSLPPQVDPATLRPGVASHPYEWELSGQGILKFIFRNILLPDSTTNEPASHGFVQFTVKQKPGNPAGTQIQNLANIYFDFNPPVTTNQVLNTIGQIYVESVSTNETDGQALQLKLFPNPATDHISFVLEDENIGGFDLRLFDLQGKLVQNIYSTGASAVLYRSSLPAGVYFFDIQARGRSVATGRLVFK